MADEPLPSEEKPASDWYRQADAELRQGHADRAEEICQGAVERFSRSGEERALSEVYHFLGNIQYQREQYEKAERSYRLAIACDERTGNERGAARTLNNLSTVASARGRHDVAKQVAEESLRIKERHKDTVGLAYGYRRQGAIAFDQGRFDDAEAWYRKSLDCVDKGADPIEPVLTLFALMINATVKGDDAAAQSWKEEAAGGLKRVENAEQVLAWGCDAYTRESFDEAIVLYSRAVQLAESHGDQVLDCRSRQFLGAAAAKLADFDLAWRCFSQASKTALQLGLEDHAAKIKKWLDWLSARSPGTTAGWPVV